MNALAQYSDSEDSEIVHVQPEQVAERKVVEEEGGGEEEEHKSVEGNESEQQVAMDISADNDDDEAEHDVRRKLAQAISNNQVKLARKYQMQIDGAQLEAVLPHAPAAKPAESTAKKIAQFHEKHHEGHHFNNHLTTLKSFRNPHILEKLVQVYNIDENGSSYPREVWDPHQFTSEDTYVGLKKIADDNERARTRQTGEPVQFQKSSSASAASGTSASGGAKAKKSAAAAANPYTSVPSMPGRKKKLGVGQTWDQKKKKSKTGTLDGGTLYFQKMQQKKSGQIPQAPK